MRGFCRFVSECFPPRGALKPPTYVVRQSACRTYCLGFKGPGVTVEDLMRCGRRLFDWAGDGTVFQIVRSLNPKPLNP